MVIVEKELKYELSKKHYLNLKDYFETISVNKQEPFTQVNFYIDTPYFALAKKDITIRIRKIFGIEESYEFTIKTPKTKDIQGSNIKIKNEFTIDLDQHVATQMIDANDLSRFKGRLEEIFHEANIFTELGDLRVLGSLKTIRYYYFIDECLEPINLDISSYLDREDYELEWETDQIEEARQILSTIYHKLGITIKNETTKSKNTRFFSQFKQKRVKGRAPDPH